MADIRIKDLATTAASTASDDFIAVDGSANGTRKLNAYSPTFGGNVVATGTLTVNSTTDSSSKDTGAIITEGGLGVEKSATIGGNLTVSGTGITVSNANPDINGLNITASTGTNAAAMKFVNSGGNYYFGADSSTGGRIQNATGIAYAMVLATESARPLMFFTNNTFGGMFSTTQNFLVGTTTDGGQKLQVSGAIAATTGGANNGIIARYSSTANIFGITINSSGQSVLSENVDASSGSDKYSTTGYPSFRLGNVGGSGTTPFWVDVAASGTSGNAITWTNALRIDNAANATFAGSIAINNTVQTAVSVASTHKVTISIGGSTYYLLATNV